jgi:hypothetical protein
MQTPSLGEYVLVEVSKEADIQILEMMFPLRTCTSCATLSLSGTLRSRANLVFPAGDFSSCPDAGSCSVH